MASFQPKAYQQGVLDSVERYFRACHDEQDADKAFYTVTKDLWQRGSPYRALPGFSPEMPYFCLRVPTGGGKTWLAAKAVRLVNSELLRTEHSLVLWLVPSNAIREQTLKGLRGMDHPYHLALREAGPITVLDLDEAKNLTRATLDTSTVIIVATRQAFQVEDEQSRKVYESSGALMHHFDDVSPDQRRVLLTDGDTVPYSFANVMRLRRPFVIVDEAHNSRTELSFETLARFRPSGILELTATPDMERTPSNVLHSVSAAELKAEEMIKLPIVLEAEPDWQRCLADAIARRNELQILADRDRLEGASYLRPIVLLQAERRRAGVETRDADRVRQELIDNQAIPPEEIIIATGEERGLEKIDAEYAGGIADERCPVKFVITQQALAEGWDCPSAYVLVSMAPLQSATAVEQLLGRVLRQPEARQRKHPALNQSYAFVVSPDFAATACELRDRLVEGAGFERQEVGEFVAAANAEQGRLDVSARPGRIVVRPVVVTLRGKPDLQALPPPVRAKVKWDGRAKTLTISKPLSEAEGAELAAISGHEAERTALAEAAVTSRTEALEYFQTPAEAGTVFAVPQMALVMQGELALFDDPEVLDYPWDLSRYPAQPTHDELGALRAAGKAAEGGQIDINEKGRVAIHFIADMQRDLGLVYRPEHWDEVKLAAWLCRNLPEPSITHTSKQAFVSGWLDALLRVPEFSLARANQYKFVLRNLLSKRIRDLRQSAVTAAYQETLFGDGREARVRVDDTYHFVFHPVAYAPSRDYDPNGEWGHWDFRKHYYGRIGDFDSKEEFECAVRLDTLAQQGRIQFWVRNLVRKEGCSFFLQRADGRFYPDFVCRLPSGKTLVVEYKGADRWDTPEAQADRLLGGLWAEMSGDGCRFVMITNRDWPTIEEMLT